MKVRSGLSLIELLAVLTILGILVSAGFAVLRLDSLGNFGAETVAHNLAKDLQLARRMAITTGDDHYLLLTTSGSSITGYTIYQAGSPAAAVDAYRQIPSQVTVTISPSASQTPSFTFEGQAASSFTLTLAGPDRSYTVTVVAATGRPQVAAL